MTNLNSLLNNGRLLILGNTSTNTLKINNSSVVVSNTAIASSSAEEDNSLVSAAQVVQYINSLRS